MIAAILIAGTLALAFSSVADDTAAEIDVGSIRDDAPLWGIESPPNIQKGTRGTLGFRNDPEE